MTLIVIGEFHPEHDGEQTTLYIDCFFSPYDVLKTKQIRSNSCQFPGSHVYTIADCDIIAGSISVPAAAGRVQGKAGREAGCATTLSAGWSVNYLLHGNKTDHWQIVKHNLTF